MARLDPNWRDRPSGFAPAPRPRPIRTALHSKRRPRGTLAVGWQGPSRHSAFAATAPANKMGMDSLVAGLAELTFWSTLRGVRYRLRVVRQGANQFCHVGRQLTGKVQTL